MPGFGDKRAQESLQSVIGDSSQTSQSRSEALLVQTVNEMTDFCRFLGDLGITAQASSPRAEERFRSFSIERQAGILASFRTYHELIASGQRDRIDFRQESSVVSFVLKKMGLSARAGTLELVRNGDVLEIYNSNMIQIFRNLEFMRVCRYSLLDLATFEFFELYERSLRLTERLISLGQQLFAAGSEAQNISLGEHIPPHPIRERFSDEPVGYLVTPRYFCPLFDESGVVAACLVVQSGEPLVVQGRDKIGFI